MSQIINSYCQSVGCRFMLTLNLWTADARVHRVATRCLSTLTFIRVIAPYSLLVTCSKIDPESVWNQFNFMDWQHDNINIQMIMICMIWSRKVVQIELDRSIFVKIFSLKNCSLWSWQSALTLKSSDWPKFNVFDFVSWMSLDKTINSVLLVHITLTIYSH